MLFAFGPEDLERFAIPIGIGIAILLTLMIPALRRSLMVCYKKGKEAGERLSGKKKPDKDDGEKTEANL
jgi:hypothetical protein